MPGTTTNLALRYPLTTEAPDGPGGIQNLAADVEDRFGRGAATVGALTPGTRYGQLAVVGTSIYRWNGSAWRLWESEWTTFNPSGAAAAYSAPTAYSRMVGGQGLLEFSSVVNGQGNAQVTLTNLPIPMRTSAQPIGNAFLISTGSVLYPLLMVGQSSTSLGFNYYNTGSSGQSSATNGQSAPVAWLNGTLFVSCRYASD